MILAVLLTCIYISGACATCVGHIHHLLKDADNIEEFVFDCFFAVMLSIGWFAWVPFWLLGKKLGI